MTARLTALLPRLAALIFIGLLAASSITFAAARKTVEQADADAKPVQQGPKTLLVPDVRHQAYVFAKGILEDAGFSWQVRGSVKGYAANTVAVQNPAPGTKVLDTGAPTITVRLEQNPDYEQRGLPENTSSYAGTRLRLASAPAGPSAGDGTAKTNEPEAADHAAGDANGGDPGTKPSKQDGPKAQDSKNGPKDHGKSRKPDFVVPGAPAEPADEMPLPDRARLLERRLAATKKPTPKLVKWWLYQQSWLVDGAQFGWHDGARALRILIRVDESLQARWGFGAQSAAKARKALARIEREASK